MLLGELGVDAGGKIDAYAMKQAPGSAQRILLGADPNTQMGLKRGLGKAASAIPGVSKNAAMRFAMSPAAKGALKVVPAGALQISVVSLELLVVRWVSLLVQALARWLATVFNLLLAEASLLKSVEWKKH